NYPAHAEIMEEAILVNIPILSFENFLLTNPAICIKMFEVLGGIIIDLQNRLEEKILYNVYDQIVLLLLLLARDNGEKIADHKYRLSISLTNGELANMIGSSRETLSRTLTKLRKQGLINQDIHGSLIVHYDQLEASIFICVIDASYHYPPLTGGTNATTSPVFRMVSISAYSSFTSTMDCCSSSSIL